MFYKITITSAIILSFVFSFSLVFAQDDSVDIADDIVEVAAEELEVEEPGVVSWFKDAFDTVRMWATRDLVKKSAIELRKASRQLIKARRIVQDNPNDENLEKKLDKINEKYKSLINSINNRMGQSQQEDSDESEYDDFLDKYVHHQLKHQEILMNLEEKLPQVVAERIRANREEHLERFDSVMNRLQNKHDREERQELFQELKDNKKELVEKIRQLRQRDRADNDDNDDNDDDDVRVN